jgi:hypothetical protein
VKVRRKMKRRRRSEKVNALFIRWQKLFKAACSRKLVLIHDAGICGSNFVVAL